MKIAKILTLFMCAGIIAAMNLKADEDNDGGDMKDIKTMDQAWKAAMDQFGDDQECAKKTLDFYKANFAEKIKYFEKELKDDPGEVVEELKGDLAECSQLLSIKDDNPEEFKKELEYLKLEAKTDLLGEKIQDMKDEDAAANKAEIEKAEKELKTEIGKLFDLKMQKEREELKNLENDIEKLRKHIDQREKNRDKIIEKKFRELTGDDEDLEF